jgi:hypothetical protein
LLIPFGKKETQLSITNDNFSLMHTNLSSMPTNVQKFKTYLELLEHKFTVIGITETWFHEGNHLPYGFEGYNAISNYRENRRVGGVSIFTWDSLNYTRGKD